MICYIEGDVVLYSFITHFDSLPIEEAPIQEPMQMHKSDHSNDIYSINIPQPTPKTTECLEIQPVSHSLQLTNIFEPQTLYLPDVWM